MRGRVYKVKNFRTTQLAPYMDKACTYTSFPDRSRFKLQESLIKMLCYLSFPYPRLLSAVSAIPWMAIGLYRGTLLAP